MITLLRRIRKSLIGSGSAKKYIIYAIGEIALVVIGILIALQVNNWNENRKTNREIEAIKHNLKSEFLQNRDVIKERRKLLDQAIHHTNTIINYIDKPTADISQEEMDSILVYTLYYGNFNPSNSSIQELIQAGGLKLLENDSLKTMIFDWLQMLDDTDEDFKNQDLHATRSLTPYLIENISMRNIDLKGLYGVTQKESRLISGYYDKILDDFKFENLMVDQMVWNTIMNKHYKELDELARNILTQLE